MGWILASLGIWALLAKDAVPQEQPVALNVLRDGQLAIIGALAATAGPLGIWFFRRTRPWLAMAFLVFLIGFILAMMPAYLAGYFDPNFAF